MTGAQTDHVSFYLRVFFSYCPVECTKALTSGNTGKLFTVVEKHARDSRGLQCGSMSTISAAMGHLGDVLRSIVQPGAQEHCERLWTALAGRHRNHAFGEAP